MGAVAVKRRVESDLVFSEDGVSVNLANAREKLRKFVDGTFQSCITSPPYWGLGDLALSRPQATSI
jgi:hypothetical protein